MTRVRGPFASDWRRSFGPVLAVVLSVVLALGTATMAVARAQAGGGGEEDQHGARGEKGAGEIALEVDEWRAPEGQVLHEEPGEEEEQDEPIFYRRA